MKLQKPMPTYIYLILSYCSQIHPFRLVNERNGSICAFLASHSAQKPDPNVVSHHKADGAAARAASGTCHITACNELTPMGTGGWSLTKTATRFPPNSFLLMLTKFSLQAKQTSSSTENEMSVKGEGTASMEL